MTTDRLRTLLRSRVPLDSCAAMTYACAFCGEDNDTFVDPGGGARQIYTEDCAVCCRPNLITVTLDADGDAQLDVTQEYEA
jgi:hypothetical protein